MDMLLISILLQVLPQCDVYFDNFSLNAISIPEPASLALIGLCITCGGMLYYRRQVSKNKQADLDVEVSR